MFLIESPYNKIVYDVLIIGGGPAGLTAAIYVARANKKVLLITGQLIGGQLMNTTHVENFPGFAEPIMGPDLMLAMIQQARNCGVEIIEETANKIERRDDGFAVVTDESMYQATAVIAATGATPKLFGIEGSLLGHGISTCATCDGSFFKGLPVAIIGGGNTAFEEAVYLSNIASSVTLVHRRNEFRADEVMQLRAKKSGVQFLTPYCIKEFVGTDALEKVQLEHCETGEALELPCEGCFIAIGHSPNTKILQGLIPLDDAGYATNSPKTTVPGLFIAGEIADYKYRQAITSAGSGCMAALDCLAYLSEHLVLNR
jgi:thioredoxin reductase (NADPH)